MYFGCQRLVQISNRVTVMLQLGWIGVPCSGTHQSHDTIIPPLPHTSINGNRQEMLNDRNRGHSDAAN